MFRKSGQSKLTFSTVLCGLALILSFLAVVLPNSFQGATAAVLGLSALVSVRLIRKNPPLMRLIAISLLAAAVTSFYMLVGVTNGAPNEALLQVFIIYIASPFLWLLVSAGVCSVVQGSSLDRWTCRLAFIAFLSVAIFFFLYFNFGRTAVAIFKPDANVYIGEGSATATMFVYGSCMYLLGGLCAAPNIAASKLWSLILVGSGVAVVLTSGRHALILSAVIGILIGIIVRRKAREVSARTGKLGDAKKRASFIVLSLAGCVIAVSALEHYQIISIQSVWHSFGEKLQSGGGEARTGQLTALLHGISGNYGLGSGHGVGVDYIRNDDFPWRYENVWAATVFRVGILGALIYCAPFIYYFYIMANLYIRKRLSTRDVFIFAGFFAAFIGSATNPYIEAFSFQWMYVFPVVYGCYRWSQESAHRRGGRA